MSSSAFLMKHHKDIPVSVTVSFLMMKSDWGGRHETNIFSGFRCFDYRFVLKNAATQTLLDLVVVHMQMILIHLRREQEEDEWESIAKTSSSLSRQKWYKNSVTLDDYISRWKCLNITEQQLSSSLIKCISSSRLFSWNLIMGKLVERNVSISLAIVILYWIIAYFLRNMKQVHFKVIECKEPLSLLSFEVPLKTRLL